MAKNGNTEFVKEVLPPWSEQQCQACSQAEPQAQPETYSQLVDGNAQQSVLDRIAGSTSATCMRTQAPHRSQRVVATELWT